jgi:hypothetical protein
VPSATTAGGLTGALSATDGSSQTYSFLEYDGTTSVSGSAALVIGYQLIVLAADGTTTATYTITVGS